MASEPGEQVTLVRNKQRALDFEPLVGEPLEADRRIGAVGAGPKILPDTRLRVEIGPDRPAVERLYLGALDAFAEHALAFAPDCQPVDLATIPSLTVPAEAVAASARLIFGEGEADESDGLRIILLNHVVARMMHFNLRVHSIGLTVAGRRRVGSI